MTDSGDQEKGGGESRQEVGRRHNEKMRELAEKQLEDDGESSSSEKNSPTGMDTGSGGEPPKPEDQEMPTAVKFCPECGVVNFTAQDAARKSNTHSCIGCSSVLTVESEFADGDVEVEEKMVRRQDAEQALEKQRQRFLELIDQIEERIFEEAPQALPIWRELRGEVENNEGLR